MRNVPSALNTHIQGEVLSLTRCFKVTRSDGVIKRLTTHDVDLTVNGEVYKSGVAIEFSAIESTDTLAVDNAEVTIGIDGTVISEDDLNNGVYDAAPFELFLVNWESVSDGIVSLKRGTFGDIEIVKGVSVKIQLRGLTQALQRPIVEKYSPTCRVALGGKKCGVINSPIRVRRPNQKVKTFDWFLVPDANITTPTFSNLSFESTVITTGWFIQSGSSWSRESAITAHSGTYYAEAGAGSPGDEHTIYREFTTSSISMSNTDVDDGDFSLDVSIQVTGTSATYNNSVKVFVEQYDAAGETIYRSESDLCTPTYLEWQGIGVTTFILPGCRNIRVGVTAIINEGSAGYIAIDNAAIRYFTNQMSTWGSKQFRVMKIPAYASSDVLFTSSFEDEGAVANTNDDANIPDLTFTTSDYWKVIASSGALTPVSGSYFLAGGNDGSSTPNSVYHAYVQETMVDATTENVTNGWYYAELQARVARIDSDSTARLVLEFRNSGGGTISSHDTGYFTPSFEAWGLYRAYLRVPVGTATIRAHIYARSGAGDSSAGIAFDVMRLACFATAYEHDDDAEYGNLSNTVPTYEYGTNDYTVDGDAIVQSRAPVFAYGTVTGVTDKRVFSASGISETAALFYSGRITWLSGNNAGRSSYVRIWDNTSKVVKLYDALPNTIQTGDKFVYAKGCDKTIARCADTFGNAHNFRGEPYLPGPSKVIEFLTASTETA